MNLDESLITSEVCVSCGRCCLFEEWEDTLDQRDQIQNGIHVCTPEEEYGSDPKSWVPIKKIEFDGRTWIGCAHWEDRVCTNYENRPNQCRQFTCFGWFNEHEDLSKYRHYEHFRPEIIKSIIAKID